MFVRTNPHNFNFFFNQNIDFVINLFVGLLDLVFWTRTSKFVGLGLLDQDEPVFRTVRWYVGQLSAMADTAVDLKRLLDEGDLAQKTHAIFEYWRRLPELFQGRGWVSHCDPFKNEVEQAIKRCKGDYHHDATYFNLVREINDGIDQFNARIDQNSIDVSKLDGTNIAMLPTMPQDAADLHQKFRSGNLSQKTDAVMKFVERAPQLREG